MPEFNNFHLVFKCISLRVMNFKRWIHRPVREIIEFEEMILISVLTVSFLSITEAQDLRQISCQICEETIDHVGNFLGGAPGSVPEWVGPMITYLKSLFWTFKQVVIIWLRLFFNRALMDSICVRPKCLLTGYLVVIRRLHLVEVAQIKKLILVKNVPNLAIQLMVKIFHVDLSRTCALTQIILITW